MSSLPVIQMFWHGAPLSRVERLSIASFLAHGHEVDLYVYEEPAGVPPGTRLMDASAILPRTSIFRHRRTKSLALFADWFRYRLLFERGGIWADTDMVCLAPFEYSGHVYAWQDDELVNNAVIGLPVGDPLASWMAELCEHPNRWLPYDDLRLRIRKVKRVVFNFNRRSETRWGESGPLGLTLALRHFGLLERALPPWHFYPVPHQRFHELFESPAPGRTAGFGESRAVHLWNNLLERQRGAKGARFPEDSPFEQLCARYLPALG